MMQKKHSFKTKSLLFHLCFLLTAGFLFSDTWTVKSAAAEEKLTLMVYMVGSDLESGSASATADLEEMRNSGVDFDKVNILVYTGGSKKWHTDEIPDDKNGLFQLTAEGLNPLKSEELKSMGEPSTLSGFLTDCSEQFPAEHFGLILWNHGNGPLIGYGVDMVHEKDSLTLKEIGEALKSSPFGKENKLDFIGFDACLMSSAELICTVDDYAKYLIASQEVEPSFGWSYAFLPQWGKSDVKSFVSSVVDSYIDYCKDYFADKKFFSSDVTLAAMDLSYGEELEDALNGVFAKAASDVSGDYPKLAAERIQTRGLGRATTGSEYDLVDVEDLMQLMSERYPKDTQAVLDILKKMVVKNGSNTTGCSGFSLYYPYYNKKYYQKSWKETYQELGLFPDYLTYLSRYEEIWLGTDMQEYFEGALVPTEKAKGEYTLQLTEEQEERYAYSRYMILKRTGEDLYSAVFVSSNVTDKKGQLKAEFDGNVIYVEFGDTGTDHLPIVRETDSVDGKTYYNTWPVFENSLNDSIAAELQLELDNESGAITVKSILSNEDDENTDELQGGKRTEIHPEDWKRVVFYNIKAAYITRDENGKLLPFFEWPEGDWITGVEHYTSDGFEFVYKPIYDDGSEYYLIFEVYDVQNNCYTSELLPITLAQAPEKEESVNLFSEPTIDASGSAVLYEDDSVTAELLLIKDPINGAKNYFVHLQNRTNAAIRLNMESIKINGSLDTLSGTVWVEADSGRECYYPLRYIPRTCMAMGEEMPESLELGFEIREIDSGKSVVKSGVSRISVSPDAQFHPLWLPAMGALADEQEIYRSDALSVKLRCLGYTQDIYNRGPDSEDAEITFVLEAENLSDEEQPFRIYGYAVNGLFRKWEQWKALQEGQKEMIIGSARLSRLKEAGIEGISSMAFLIAEGEKTDSGEMCDVRLSASADAEEFHPEGELLYSDDMIDIFNLGCQESEALSGTDYIWPLYVVNKSSQNLWFSLSDITLDGEKGEYFYGLEAGEYLVPPDHTVYYSIEARYQEEKPELTGAFVWTDGNYPPEEYGRTETFDWRDL